MSSNYISKTCSDLLPGEIVLHPVYRSDRLLFIKKYKKLTASVIWQLKRHFPSNYPFIIAASDEIFKAFLMNNEGQGDAFLEDIKKIIEEHQRFINSPLSIGLYLEVNSIGEKESEKGLNDNMSFIEILGLDVQFPLWEQLEMIFDSPRIFERASTVNSKVIDLLLKDQSLQALYKRVSNFHDVLLLNSLNSTFISFVIGLTLELRDDEMVDLILASLFADIGFTEFEKKDYIAYLEFGKNENKVITEQLKKSIELLSSSPYCRRKSVILGVFDHHERYDGLGKPLGKQKEEIHLFGRIISIAQQYDEMVGGYRGGKSIMTFDAIKELWNQRGMKIDPNIIRVFIDRTNILKVGQKIRISNNKTGEIIGFNNYLHNPMDILIR